MLIFNYGSTHFSNKVVLTQFISAVVWDAILSTLVLFYRSTWAVFPYTLLFLCWHSLALRAGKIFSLIKEKKNQPVTADAPKGFMLGASTAMGWVLLWGFLDNMQNKIDVHPVAQPSCFENIPCPINIGPTSWPNISS